MRGERIQPVHTRASIKPNAIQFDVCEYDGDRCAALGATRNVDGVWCRKVGATFVHLELAREVRDNPGQRTLVARTAVDDLMRAGALDP